jgi:hypothetical protein
LESYVKTFPGEGEWLLFNEWGDQLGAHVYGGRSNEASQSVPAVTPAFRYHDLRHS